MPLIFHDIDMEIPEDSKSTVLTLYRIWQFLILTLLVNLVAGILLLISGANNGGSDLGASIFYVPVIGILSFLMWYRPIYNAYMKESAVFYCTFTAVRVRLADREPDAYFLFGGFHIAFCSTFESCADGHVLTMSQRTCSLGSRPGSSSLVPNRMVADPTAVVRPA